MKKWVCTVCGYVYEGENAPEFCPVCKAPASKFKEMEDAVDDDMTFATVHVLGQAYKDGVNEDVIKGLKDHFNGECGEVGMYLAMARQADREGYPEIAEIEKIIENQNGRWKDFEVFAERLLGFTMERYGRNLNTEQRRQYFAKEKKLLRAMCENPNTHNIARAQNEAEVLMK